MKEDTHSNIREYLILAVVFIFWGSVYVVSKVLMTGLPVFFVSFCRYLIAWIALTAMLEVRKNVTDTLPQKYDRRGVIAVILFGLIGYTISIDCQLAGTKLIPASMASLINSANPVSIALFSCLFLKEPLTGYRVAGIGLAIFGVYLIVGGSGGIADPAGLLLSVASVLLWSLATIISRKELSRFDPVRITRDGMSVAVICNFFICAGELLYTHTSIHLDLMTVIGLIYLGLFCTVGTHLLWNRALGKLPANVCSSFYPIQPLSSTILGVIFLHESVGFSFFVGAVFVVAGILISLYVKKPSK